MVPVHTDELTSVQQSWNSMGNLVTCVPHLGDAAISVRLDIYTDNVSC